MLVPIGGWCRTAHQVAEYLKTKNITSVSYPYDWSITPFCALEKTLSPEFDLKKVLKISNVKPSIIPGVPMDTYTGVIHAHGGIQQDSKVKSARDRFAHTYSHLESLRSDRGRHGFVRWIREGHPNQYVPYAFDGEDLSTLSGVIRGFLKRDKFSVLRVTTIDVEEIPSTGAIKEYKKYNDGVEATIYETKHFSGDGTETFFGDRRSWIALLSRYVKEEKIKLKRV